MNTFVYLSTNSQKRFARHGNVCKHTTSYKLIMLCYHLTAYANCPEQTTQGMIMVASLHKSVRKGYHTMITFERVHIARKGYSHGMITFEHIYKLVRHANYGVITFNSMSQLGRRFYDGMITCECNGLWGMIKFKSRLVLAREREAR